MKRVFNIAKNFKEAEEWDIYQHINMKPEERIKIVKQLEDAYFGKENPDVRETRFFKCRKVVFRKT